MTDTDISASKNEDALQDNTPFFSDLGLDARVLAAVTDAGYVKPSPIQAATIPALLDGRDVVGMAQTGTGKTAAFALPALSKMAELSDIHGVDRETQVLVLAPTRELALQVSDNFAKYAEHMPGVTVLPVYGGSAYGPQLAGLRAGAQVVVGTPGRVIDHLEKGSLDLSNLQYLVLDEADEMLRMGFAEDVERILSETPEDKQVALFSATMPRAIRNIAQKYLNDPAEISVKSKTQTASNIRQRYVQVMGAHKLDAMTRILETEDHDGVIVFVRTKMATEEVADKLKSRGFEAAAINGDIPQALREKTVEALRAGKIDVLVATDVAARGLDVERISHVINFDIPRETESYVHRIGRTGRAGRTGEAILFMTPREKYLLRAIERATKQTVEQVDLPSVAEVNSRRLGRFGDRITRTLERSAERAAEGKKSDFGVFRDMVAEYVSEHGADPVDVAAALAEMVQGGRPLLMEELPETPKMQRDRDRGKRDGFNSRGPSRPVSEGNATYRIAVGRRDNVLPGSIVGAIANEAGLTAAQIGGIDIRSNHTLVELPANLTKDQQRALAKTRIGGNLIKLELDTGRKPRREGDSGERFDRFERPERGERPGRGGRPAHREARSFEKNDGDARHGGRGADKRVGAKKAKAGANAKKLKPRKPRTKGKR